MMLIIIYHHLINVINESELIRDNSEGKGYHREGGGRVGFGWGLGGDRARSGGYRVVTVRADVSVRFSAAGERN